MKEFISKHPFLTFFLGLAALGTIEYVAGATALAVAPPAPSPSPGHVGFDADLPVIAPNMQGMPGFDGYGSEEA